MKGTSLNLTQIDRDITGRRFLLRAASMVGVVAGLLAFPILADELESETEKSRDVTNHTDRKTKRD